MPRTDLRAPCWKFSHHPGNGSPEAVSDLYYLPSWSVPWLRKEKTWNGVRRSGKGWKKPLFGSLPRKQAGQNCFRWKPPWSWSSALLKQWRVPTPPPDRKMDVSLQKNTGWIFKGFAKREEWMEEWSPIIMQFVFKLLCKGHQLSFFAFKKSLETGVPDFASGAIYCLALNPL